MAGLISGSDHVGRAAVIGIAGGRCRADAEADAKADTPTTGLGLVGGEHGAHGQGGERNDGDFLRDRHGLIPS
jgi:hypothetical protein